MEVAPNAALEASSLYLEPGKKNGKFANLLAKEMDDLVVSKAILLDTAQNSTDSTNEEQPSSGLEVFCTTELAARDDFQAERAAPQLGHETDQRKNTFSGHKASREQALRCLGPPI
eukprot:4770259-Amphidinium_carterae.2